mgnify:FL=1
MKYIVNSHLGRPLCALLITVTMFICVPPGTTLVGVPEVAAKERVSGGGRNPPKKLKERQIELAKRIIAYLKANYPKEKPIEIIAIALVETNLKENLVSHTGDWGVLQVNCRIHRKKLKNILGIRKCKELHELNKNIDAAIYILNRFRRYKTCRGNNLYACYNGGQGWKVAMKKCYAATGKKSCSRPYRYKNSVRKHLRLLERKYSYLF